MTIKELKEKLNNVDDDLEVVFFVESAGDTDNYVLINYTDKHCDDEDGYFVLRN